MNKDNTEQPDNIEESKEQKIPEVSLDNQEFSDQAQESEETQLDKQIDTASEAVKESFKKRNTKTSETKGSGADTETSDTVEKVVAINRITKVTKGGKKLSFSALVVVGDTRGNVGYSLEKAAEVAIAIRKAMATAKKNMVKIPMKGTTIPHEIIGRCGGSRVLLKPASDGTGVIASGPVRAVCDGVGIHNILTKCHRSNNPINVVKATIDGLTRLKTIKPLNK